MMLARALKPRCELLVASFTRQYPNWLYPGEMDREPGAPSAEVHACYLLDSLDPRTWRATADRVADYGPAAVIIPWWTVFWAPCFGYLLRRLRRQGIPAYLFCHNVLDHEAATWKRTISRQVLRQAQGFFVQSEQEERRLRELAVDGPVTVHGHPVFKQFPPAASGLPRRAALELLFFGIVRRYKGLDVLLDAISRLQTPDLMLTVAGEFWGDLATTYETIERFGISDCVEVVPRYVHEHEAARLFTRADVVVMPYSRATGSGVLGLAYHYGKPVIASRIPGIEEHVLHGETGLLVPPGSPSDLAQAILAIDARSAAAMGPAIARMASGLTWDSLAQAVLQHVTNDALGQRK